MVAPDDRHVQRRSSGECQDRLRQRVVHEGIEPVAAEPVRRDLPDLPDEVGIGADGSAARPELLPERLVVDLRRYVEPPAVDPEAEPVLGDPEQVLAHLGLVRVQLGQGRQVPPRLVAER